VQKNLAGHVRLNAARTAEFAAGWDDSILSKQAVSLLMSARDPSMSRRWLHAYATPKGPEALVIRACTCGNPKAYFRLPGSSIR
jgi:hypothetical protein